MKPIKTKLKDNNEPLIELFYQEFPNKDPQEIERMINTVKKWLNQEIERIQRDKKTLNEKFHENIDLRPFKDPVIVELTTLLHQLEKQVKE